MSTQDAPKLLPRWYFGGLGAAGGVFFTHPLDLMKVQLQTQGKGKKGLVVLTKELVKREGVLALYNGLTASVFRQLTYSTVRFGIYDTAKVMMGGQSSFLTKVIVAFVAGGIGGYIGTPPDKVNVRMQNDVKLPHDKRYNYKHVFDGLFRIYKEEGFNHLFGGSTMASVRAAVIAVGQISFYDQIKIVLLTTPYFDDNLVCHFTTSFIAGGIATALAQPLDVLKTRIMNAKPGEFDSIMAVVVYTAKEGPLGFFKGFVPAFLRIAPQTILTFVFYEQLRLHFGYYAPKKNE